MHFGFGTWKAIFKRTITNLAKTRETHGGLGNKQADGETIGTIKGLFESAVIH